MTRSSCQLTINRSSPWACLAIGTCVALSPVALAQSCPDLTGDGIVDGGDLGEQLASWGPCAGCAADLDRSGAVDGADIAVLLSVWGAPGDCLGVPGWALVVQSAPDPAVVTDPALRAAIVATGLPWRVRDAVTQVEMLLVPPGTFEMGCIMGSNQHGCLGWEQPVHTVTLTQPFYLGRFELTQAQWQARMGSNPSNFVAANGFPGPDARPVERVSWDAAQAFCASTGMRLPTEAEWEFACRAGTQTPFHNGSTDDATLGDLAWHSPNSGSRTHAVGGKAANAFGFHDMLGNVSEWVNDRYGSYAAGAQTDPVGPDSSSFRVVRGGSWYDGGLLGNVRVRSSYRGNGTPNAPRDYLGFRVARNP